MRWGPHIKETPRGLTEALRRRECNWVAALNLHPHRPDLQALETLAEWRESLDVRFRRAQLEYGLIGKDSAELRALYSEGQAWKRVCRTLLFDGEAAH